MGSMSALHAEIRTSRLCGSCRLYQGDALTGMITGFCPVDGKGARADGKPCRMYEDKGRSAYEN